MFKACSRCGKIHPANYQCNIGKVYQGGEERQLRGKYVWQLKSQEIREKAQYLCEVCRDQGEISYEKLEVHHITPLREDSTLLLDNNNLVCLCVSHHKQADNNELDRDYLRKLARIREEEEIPPCHLSEIF